MKNIRSLVVIAALATFQNAVGQIEEPAQKQYSLVTGPTVICADSASGLNGQLRKLRPGTFTVSGLTSTLVRRFSEYVSEHGREFSLCAIVSPLPRAKTPEKTMFNSPL